MGKFKGRAIKRVAATAMPIEPKKSECTDLTATEFAAFYAEYVKELADWKAEKASPKTGNTDDAKNGPGAKGWVNTDATHGPGMQIAKDKVTGPGAK